jgi:mono/diheme cytochrome c family protein
MKKIAISLGALALCTTAAIAQDAGPDPAAGKALWEGNVTQCKNCHGAKGEGGFGPDLAGRGLSGAEFAQAVRQPWGIMPAFVDSQVSDADLANMAAYFASLPKVGGTGPWRVPVLPATPHGQQVAAVLGCAQCHGPTLDFPRGTLGAANGDITLLKNLVYAHTTTMAEVDEMLNPPQPGAAARPPQRLRMGNFNAMRVTDAQLQDIYDWLKNDVGFRPALQARLAADPSGSGAYTITLANNGLKDMAEERCRLSPRASGAGRRRSVRPGGLCHHACQQWPQG